MNGDLAMGDGEDRSRTCGTPKSAAFSTFTWAGRMSLGVVDGRKLLSRS
jgi:hypothetical protein